MTRALFIPQADTYVPTPDATGPWSAQALFGGAPAALAVHEVLRVHSAGEWRAARVTTDLIRPAPQAPLTVRTRELRSGRRVQSFEAMLYAPDGGPVSRTTVLLLAGGDAAEATAPSPRTAAGPEAWERIAFAVPHPSVFDLMEVRGPALVPGRRQLSWARFSTPIVAGRPLSGLERAAFVADLAAGVMNSDGPRVEYINADVTLYLHRRNESEWIAVDPRARELGDGTVIGNAGLADRSGVFASVTTASVAAPAVAVA